MSDWILQENGTYHSADATRRLIFFEEAGCWWNVPFARRPGSAGYSLGEMKGPYKRAEDAGSIDALSKLELYTPEGLPQLL